MYKQLKLNLVALALLLPMSAVTHAEWDISLGYSDFSYPATDYNEDGFSLQAASVSVGYEFSNNSSFSYKPELRIGFGTNEDLMRYSCNGDIICRDEVKIDYFISASIRGTYLATDSVYIFIQPSYMQIKTNHPKFEDNSNSTKETTNFLDDSFQLGLGAGLGFKPISSINLEISYEKLDDVEAITGSVRYSF